MAPGRRNHFIILDMKIKIYLEIPSDDPKFNTKGSVVTLNINAWPDSYVAQIMTLKDELKEKEIPFIKIIHWEY